MAVADGSGLPLSLHTASASPHKVILVRDNLKECIIDGQPPSLIGDRAYVSDPLDQALAQEGIELIAPHRENRKNPPTQDGRSLRRYRRRWHIERLFAWMHNFRRLVVHYEYHIQNFLAFAHLACTQILLRRYF